MAKIKLIDDANFPDLKTAEERVRRLISRLSNGDVIALYVFMEGTEHEAFNVVSEAVWKIAGYEEEDGMEEDR